MNHGIRDLIDSSLEGRGLPDSEVWNEVVSMLRSGRTTDLDITAEASMANGLGIALASITGALYTAGEMMDDEFGDILIGHAINIMEILDRLEDDIDDRVADIVVTDGDDE